MMAIALDASHKLMGQMSDVLGSAASAPFGCDTLRSCISKESASDAEIDEAGGS